MIIRKAHKKDLRNIMNMYNSCVSGMIKNNIDQWDESYPNTEIIALDLEAATYYVVESKGTSTSYCFRPSAYGDGWIFWVP